MGIPPMPKHGTTLTCHSSVWMALGVLSRLETFIPVNIKFQSVLKEVASAQTNCFSWSNLKSPIQFHMNLVSLSVSANFASFGMFA